MSLTRAMYGWTLPRNDKHFVEYLANAPKVEGRRMYQPDHIQCSVGHCRSKRVAVDVGAHVGFWSYYLAMAFQSVHAFEPTQLLSHCFQQNVRAKNVVLHRVALGNSQGTVRIDVEPGNSGATHVEEGAAGDIPLKRLDDFALPDVDFIKIDVEGYERFVLEGAAETLGRCKPVVIVEQKEFSGRYGVTQFAAVEYLQSLGAQVVDQVVKDLVLAWP